MLAGAGLQIQAAHRTYYIQCPAKMGLWVPDGQHAVLIDSGGDKDAGRKVQKIFTHYHLTMDFSQCVLVGSTVRSYLAYLPDKGAVAASFDDSRLLWQAV